MASVSGVSVSGVLVTALATPPLSLSMAIAITSARLPPQKRIGYYWVYLYVIASPNQHYLVQRGAVYSPGVYSDLVAKIATGAYGLRLDTLFDYPGFSYICTVL